MLRRVLQRTETPGAALQLAILRAGARLSAPVKLRGLGRLTMLLGGMGFDAGNACVLPVHARSRIEIRLNDYYWTRLLGADFTYERELAQVLSALLTKESVFIDGGANIGYWSLMAAETVADPRRIIAIEAGEAIFERLCRNAALNGGAYDCVRRAINRETGKTVSFEADMAHHAGAHIVADSGSGVNAGAAVENVETVALDDLMEERFGAMWPRSVIVKLDVEGAEVAAMQGATRLLQGENTLLIYEDHGRDTTHEPTRHVMGELGLKVYGIVDGRIVAIDAPDRLAAIKRRPNIGYNFFACKAGGDVDAWFASAGSNTSR